MNKIGFILLLLIFQAVSALAQQKEHTVKQGETLFAISKKYEVSMDDIKKWNNLKTNDLKVGMILKVQPPPSSTIPKQTQTPPKSTKTPTTSGASTATTLSVHTVAPKETLFSISRMYNMSLDELKQLNSLKSNDLDIGQELKVFSLGSNPAKTNEPEKPFVSKFQAESKKSLSYTVQRGDNLFKIAAQFGMTIEQIKNLNNLKSNDLAVGQILLVREAAAPPSISELSSDDHLHPKYVMYEVNKGDDIKSISAKFELEPSDLFLLNPGVDFSSLTAKQRIIVLKPGSLNHANPYLTKKEIVASLTKDSLSVASFSVYAAGEQGKVTTSGDLLNNNQLTAAHASLPLNSRVVLVNPETGKSIIVSINDRVTGKGFKFTQSTAVALGINTLSIQSIAFKPL